jgi:hypothetical protein
LSVKPWQAKILLALVSIIIGLVVVETGLRLMGIEYPLFYDYDPYLGNKLRPGVKGYYVSEGRGYVSINRDGLRDREHPVSHPANTLRIAVLGDSYTEAMQVNADEAFWAVMAKELQHCDNLRDRKVEVINFGQSDFGTTQELLVLRHKVWKYSPDVVLLAFTTGNDISDNSRTLKHNDYYPYYVYQGNKLVLEDRQTYENWVAKENGLLRRVIFYWGIDNLRVFQLIRHCKELFLKWWALQDLARKANASGIGQEAGINDTIYREPTTKTWQEAWRVTEGLLLLMRDEVARHGAQFFVVTLTNGIQVDPQASHRIGYAKWLGVSDLFYSEHRLQSFCQSHHLPILPLGPYFQKYADQHQVYLHGFGKALGTGHWNQNGHRLAGQTIAQWLCPQLN